MKKESRAWIAGRVALTVALTVALGIAMTTESAWACKLYAFVARHAPDGEAEYELTAFATTQASNERSWALGFWENHDTGIDFRLPRPAEFCSVSSQPLDASSVSFPATGTAGTLAVMTPCYSTQFYPLGSYDVRPMYPCDPGRAWLKCALAKRWKLLFAFLNKKVGSVIAVPLLSAGREKMT